MAGPKGMHDTHFHITLIFDSQGYHLFLFEPMHLAVFFSPSCLFICVKLVKKLLGAVSLFFFAWRLCKSMCLKAAVSKVRTQKKTRHLICAPFAVWEDALVGWIHVEDVRWLRPEQLAPTQSMTVYIKVLFSFARMFG